MSRILINKIRTTFEREGLKAIFKKVYRRGKYKMLRLRYGRRNYHKDWKQLKNKYKGERVFLIGNGPSLNKTPLYLLKDEHTLCFNRFYLMSDRLNWNPSFYMSMDNLVLDDILDEIDEIAKMAGEVFLPDIHFRGHVYFDKIKYRNNLHWLKQLHGRGFSTDLPYVYPGGSVIYEGFQVLKHMGFNDIYFVGVDMNFQTHNSAKKISGGETDIISQDDNDPNHFDPRYFGKSRKYHQPEDYVVNFIMQNLKYLSEKTDRLGINIYNAGYDSLVEYFKKVEFEDVFSFSEEEKRELIDDCFRRNTGFSGIGAFLNNSSEIATAEEWNPELRHFHMGLTEALQIIPKTVFTHIPIGPYNGRYFFIRRN